MSPGVCFDAPGEKHYAARIKQLSFLVQKLFAKKKTFAKTAILAFFWPMTPKPLMLPQICWYIGERTAQIYQVLFSPASYQK